MNFFGRKQANLKAQTTNESKGSGGVALSTNSSTSISSISSSNLKNLSPLNIPNTSTSSTTPKPKPVLNLGSSTNTSSTTVLTLPIQSISNSPLPSNQNSNQNTNSTFSLPSINASRPHSASNETFGRANSLNNPHHTSNNSFSGGISLMKNNPKDIRSKLNDFKNFIDIETNSSSNNNIITRPSVLTPINTGFNSAPLPDHPSSLSPVPPRPNRKSFTPFDFSTTPRSNKQDSLDKVIFGLGERKESSSFNIDTPPSLKLPDSLRSSDSSLESAPNSASRLEAANSNKFKEIIGNAGYLWIDNKRIKTSMDDLTSIGELGSGTCGYVIKMKHNQSGCVMAVKQMRISGKVEENKRIIMDLDVVVKSHDCKYIVKCLGYFISESDVWICMELMSLCFDKLLKLIKGPIPENILGKLTVSTLNALNYLKANHNVIHRDIKPSNILIDDNGEIKLCDFGISGNLINSNAFSRNNTGCAGYMAPERIDPTDPTNPVYDIRADVWSLGITLVELATGQFPYKNCNSDFEVMSTILDQPAPTLEGDQFSEMFKSFVNQCLTKDVNSRPKYNILLQHPFVKYYSENNVDVKTWFRSVKQANNITVNNEKEQLSVNNGPNDLNVDSISSKSELITPVGDIQKSVV